MSQHKLQWKVLYSRLTNRNYAFTMRVRTDEQVMSLTQENTADLHSVGRVPYLSRRVGGKHLDAVKNKSFTNHRTQLPFCIYKQSHVSAIDDHSRAINTTFLK
jgi:hypothetical protein